MRRETHALSVPIAANGSGTALDVSDFQDFNVQIEGTFSATVAVEATISGTRYEAIQTLSAPGLVVFPDDSDFTAIRITVSNYISGQPVATLAERASRTT